MGTREKDIGLYHSSIDSLCLDKDFCNEWMRMDK